MKKKLKIVRALSNKALNSSIKAIVLIGLWSFSAWPAAAQSTLPSSSPAAAPTSFTVEQQKDLNNLIENYIRKNPEIIIQSIQALQAREQASSEERARLHLVASKPELEQDPTSPVGGNPNGDITIVEFFDYQCGYCKKVFPIVKKLLKEDGNIRYVYKEFPILGPDSVAASKAALAVWKISPEKYSAFHGALMKNRGALPLKRVLKLAKSVGIDAVKIKTEMNSAEILTIVDKTYALATRLNINGTPAFIIGDQLIPGAADEATLKQAVALAREKNKKS